MSDETFKCVDCEKELDRDNADYHYSFGGEPICYDCYSCAEEYASTLVHFTPDGEKYVSKFDDRQLFWSDHEEYYDEMPAPVATQRWVSTGGWGGYTDHSFLDGYVQVSDGWVTGYPDDTVQRKYDVAEFYSDLQDGTIVPPCDLWWLFATTSNIFSTATTVICKKEDLPAIERWLQGQSADLDNWLA